MKRLLVCLLLLFASTCQAEEPMLLSWMGPIMAGGGVNAVADPCASCSSSNDGIRYNFNNAFDTDNGLDAWLAGQFTIASAICSTGVTAAISDYGSTTAATAEIYTDSSGTPGSRVGAGYTATVANLPDTVAATEFLWSATQNLAAGTYWVVIKPAASIAWGRKGSGGSGTFYYSQLKDGSDWATASWKLDFNVLGCTQ